MINLVVGLIRRWLHPEQYQAALDAYWDAETPRQEREAYRLLRRFGNDGY